MSGELTYRRPPPSGQSVSSALGGSVLLFLVLALGLPLILFTVDAEPFITALIFLVALFVGLQQCNYTQRVLGDAGLRQLKVFWLIKLALTLFLLYAGWIPQLDPGSPSWGYDPQRFYQDAKDLIDNGWEPVAGSNYQGIIYYYGVVFYLFGHNPVVPALCNAFVTLLGTLYLIRLAYEFKGQRGSGDWIIAYLLLIPEVIWYDVMTSRETLSGVLILVSSLASGRYIVNPHRVSLTATLFLVCSAIAAILAVRTSMVLPIFFLIALMVLLLSPLRGRGIMQKLIISGMALALLAVGPLVQQIAGGAEVDYLETARSAQQFDLNAAASDNTEWAQNSIGLLIAPNDFWQWLLFIPPRMVLYILAPLPNVWLSLTELIAGSWFEWQKLMTIPSSVLNILVLPYAIAGFFHAYRRRRIHPSPLVIHFSFLISFIAIAGGNIIIHERYRLMMTLLLFASAWLGYCQCTRLEVFRVATVWVALLVLGVVSYVIVKMF